MSYKIEHRIGVSAPAEVIWEILADIPGWEAWNPLYTQASGVIRIGEILVLTQALPGQKPEVIRPRVLDWVPYEQLHWNNVAGSGLVKTLRYMEIEKLGDEACIFSNGEIFAGLLGPTVAKAMRRSFKDGFCALSEAIKVRAEAAYAAVEKPKAKKKKAAPVDPATIKLVKPIEPVKPLVNFDKSFRLKKKR
jgi:hypothetical protein